MAGVPVPRGQRVLLVRKAPLGLPARTGLMEPKVRKAFRVLKVLRGRLVPLVHKGPRDREGSSLTIPPAHSSRHTRGPGR